jgi:hypothetical protein
VSDGLSSEKENKRDAGEIRISKYETNSKEEIGNDKNIKRQPPLFRIFEFPYLNLFRISDFGFRI